MCHSMNRRWPIRCQSRAKNRTSLFWPEWLPIASCFCIVVFFTRWIHSPHAHHTPFYLAWERLQQKCHTNQQHDNSNLPAVKLKKCCIRNSVGHIFFHFSMLYYDFYYSYFACEHTSNFYLNICYTLTNTKAAKLTGSPFLDFFE